MTDKGSSTLLSPPALSEPRHANKNDRGSSKLPPELLSIIFLQLDPHTLFTSVRALSRQWRHAVETNLLPNQFHSGRWKVGLRIAKTALPAPIHSTGTSERAVMEAAVEAANAAVMDNPDLAVARLRDLLNTPGTLETHLPLPGPRPLSTVTIPLTFVGYDRKTASLSFTSDAWHAITSNSKNRSGLLDCTFHIVWNEADSVSLESAKPNPQNHWLNKFYLSDKDSKAMAPNKFSKGGCDSPLPTKLVSTPLAPRVLAPRNTSTNDEDRSSGLGSASYAPTPTAIGSAHQSRLLRAPDAAHPQNASILGGPPPPTGQLDWSDASHHYMHLRTLALGIEFFTRQSARANLLTRKLEAERERRLRGEASSSEEDDDDDDSEEESESSEEEEETIELDSIGTKGHESMSSSISSLSLSRHGSTLKLKDLEYAAAALASANVTKPSAASNSSSSGSSKPSSGSGSGATTTAYMTAAQSKLPSGASTPSRANGMAGPTLRPPTYADFAKAAAKGSNSGSSSPQLRPSQGPVRPMPMRPQAGLSSSPRLGGPSGSSSLGTKSPVLNGSQLKKELDIGKGKAKLKTPFSTPFSGTPYPGGSSPVPSRPGTPGPSAKQKGSQDGKGAAGVSSSTSNGSIGSPSIRARNTMAQNMAGSGSPLRTTRAASITTTTGSTGERTEGSGSASTSASSSGPPSLRPPGTPASNAASFGPRVPRAHFHAVLYPAERFSPAGSAASSPRLGPSTGAGLGQPSNYSLTQPIMRSTSLGGAARRSSLNNHHLGSAATETGGNSHGMPPASWFAAKRAADHENWNDRLVDSAEAELRRLKREREQSVSSASGSRNVSESQEDAAGRRPLVRRNTADGDAEADVNHGSVWRAGDAFSRGQWRTADQVPGGEVEAEQAPVTSGNDATSAEDADDDEDEDSGAIEWTWTR
ncbi:hypothetical protein OC861_001889 [Tilletia horrida]|nr:hypothetical protein OC861_001889 [Tilletia horrida]